MGFLDASTRRFWTYEKIHNHDLESPHDRDSAGLLKAGEGQNGYVDGPSDEGSKQSNSLKIFAYVALNVLSTISITFLNRMYARPFPVTPPAMPLHTYTKIHAQRCPRRRTPIMSNLLRNLPLRHHLPHPAPRQPVSAPPLRPQTPARPPDPAPLRLIRRLSDPRQPESRVQQH